MGSFRLGGMTLGSLFKKPETTCYPFEKKPAPAGLKGQIVNDVDMCILCGLCQKTCPCNAIDVEKKDRIWAIDRFLCIQCGSCVRACPKKCLSMEPNMPMVASAQSTVVCFVPDPKAKVAEKMAAETKAVDKVIEHAPAGENAEEVAAEARVAEVNADEAFEA